MTAPYDALAAVYDRWTARNDYRSWVSFITRLLPEPGRVLDVCCGTGTMAGLLLEAGHRVGGVDRSAAMLERARRKLPPGTPLRQADLAAPLIPDRSGYDAAVCCFDSVNYFLADDDLARLFAFVHASLRPGGVFVFDVNTRHKLEHAFGSSHYGDDLGTFAYVWRNSYRPERGVCGFAISLFVEGPSGSFTRHEEWHEQRWFGHDELRSAAKAAGFVVERVTDDYTELAPVADTLRESWVLRRPAG